VVGRRQVVELPPVRPVVVEAQRVRVRCRRCQHSSVGHYPDGMTAHGGFGPRLAASAAYLHEEQHLAYARLVTLYQELFGLRISEGSLVALVSQVGTALRPAADAIAAMVCASPVIGSDETSTRIDGVTSWHWVFQAPDAAAHLIAGRRNGAVVRGFLGDAAPDCWVSDRWKPQLGAAATAHQECLAHRLRDLQYAIDAQASPSQAAGRAWVGAVAALLRGAIHLRHEHDCGAISDAQYPSMVAVVEDGLDWLLAAPAASQWSVDLAAALRRERALLLVFLHDDRVPPTNNASERSLRPVVVHRKVTGGFRSEAAAQTYAAVRTVLETARKRGHSAFAALLDAAGPLLSLTPVPAGYPA
jgi:transposase